jgi:hypothetical protein
MSGQEMERAEVFFAQPLPALSSLGRPQVACQASGQPLAAVFDLGQRLLALVATADLVIDRHFAIASASARGGCRPRAS